MSAGTDSLPEAPARNASLAAKVLESHLTEGSLGGEHPVSVVVPREELLAVLDGYRRYLAKAVATTIREGHRV